MSLGLFCNARLGLSLFLFYKKIFSTFGINNCSQGFGFLSCKFFLVSPSAITFFSRSHSICGVQVIEIGWIVLFWDLSNHFLCFFINACFMNTAKKYQTLKKYYYYAIFPLIYCSITEKGKLVTVLCFSYSIHFNITHISDYEKWLLILRNVKRYSPGFLRNTVLMIIIMWPTPEKMGFVKMVEVSHDQQPRRLALLTDWWMEMP